MMTAIRVPPRLSYKPVCIVDTIATAILPRVDSLPRDFFGERKGLLGVRLRHK
jgi:hypothetical protein